jgi:hypothetical protein
MLVKHVQEAAGLHVDEGGSTDKNVRVQISGWPRVGGGRHTVHQDTYIQFVQSIDSVTFDLNVASHYGSSNEAMNLLLDKIFTVIL